MSALPPAPLPIRTPARHGTAATPHTVLVLGGGGMKGMAHVGALRALADHGVAFDAVVGTSIGALIGALVAAGRPVHAMEDMALGLRERDVLRRNKRALWVGGIAQPSICRGDPLQALIGRLLGTMTFPALALPLRVNAVSLRTGTERWFGHGADLTLRLPDAVYASAALPLIFPPLEHEDDVLVDGGMLSFVGLAEAARWGAARRIAIDVSEPLVPDLAWRARGLAGAHLRTVQIVGEHQRLLLHQLRGQVPTLHVRPDLPSGSTFTFTKTVDFIVEGYRATAAALRSPEAAAFLATGPRRLAP